MIVTALWSSLPQPLRVAFTSALVGAVLLIYPFADRILGLGTLYAVSDAMIYVLLALGLNIVVGYAGLLDLGYASAPTRWEYSIPRSWGSSGASGT
jgi:branched-chain amino acid transport system permease protein